jgi:hypothetical protein
MIEYAGIEIEDVASGVSGFYTSRPWRGTQPPIILAMTGGH